MRARSHTVCGVAALTSVLGIAAADAGDESNDPVELRKLGSRAYLDQKQPLTERLALAEQRLRKALQHCGADADCYNLTHFGLACVLEDQYRLLLRDNRREAASQKLLDSLNAYERFISQHPAVELANTALLLPVEKPLADDELACPPLTIGKQLTGKQRQEHTLNQALTGRDRLVVQVRPTHGRLLLQFPTSSLSFRINDEPYLIVKRPERPLPIWLPQGQYPVTWNDGAERIVVTLRAGESLTQLIGVIEKPVVPKEPVVRIEPAPAPPPPVLERPLKRAPRWTLIGVGIPLMLVGGFLMTGGAVGYSIDGQCADDTCSRVYNSQVAAPAYLGSGIGSLALGALLVGIGGYGRLPSAQPTPQPTASAPRSSDLAK